MCQQFYYSRSTHLDTYQTFSSLLRLLKYPIKISLSVCFNAFVTLTVWIKRFRFTNYSILFHSLYARKFSWMFTCTWHWLVKRYRIRCMKWKLVIAPIYSYELEKNLIFLKLRFKDDLSEKKLCIFNAILWESTYFSNSLIAKPEVKYTHAVVRLELMMIIQIGILWISEQFE